MAVYAVTFGINSELHAVLLNIADAQAYIEAATGIPLENHKWDTGGNNWHIEIWKDGQCAVSIDCRKGEK